jgi:2-polyprenyl-6-hydroxyphenyl methylase/3-demethylubiquinone-9 3-methyltransferase
MGTLLRGAGLRVADITGLVFDPLARRWKASRDTGVNYLLEATS